ncbi:hypothetical protein KCU77_g507, partial [Aureobasidium melanogenum]
LPDKILFARHKNLKTSVDPLHLVSGQVRQETIALEKYELGIFNWYHTNNLLNADFHALRADYKDEFNAEFAIDINGYLGGASPTTLQLIPILTISRTTIDSNSCSTVHLRMRPLSKTRCRRGKKHESGMSTPWAVHWVLICVMHVLQDDEIARLHNLAGASLGARRVDSSGHGWTSGGNWPESIGSGKRWDELPEFATQTNLINIGPANY